MKNATIIVDAGYGDAGKGKLAYSIAKRTGAKLIVRYNGGAQAGHRVVLPDGREHVFSQFGSATFLPGVQTYLSQNMILQPLAMAAEEAHLASLGVDDAYERTLVDEDALVITPYHQAANRIREMVRGQGRHGSCGMGISETVSDALAHRAIRAKDLLDRTALVRKLREIGEAKNTEIALLISLLKYKNEGSDEIRIFEDAEIATRCADKMFELAKRMRIVSRRQAFALMNTVNDLVFEGSQGVLLDEWYGFFPYATRSTTTAQKARELLAASGFAGKVTTIAVMRAYATRHGAGPFVTEDAELTSTMPDACNVLGQWQGNFRIGWMDMLATRYALDAVGQ
ncbi:MAG: adenylosuccinate synthetase, partial [Patescibacteria group bacterium]